MNVTVVKGNLLDQDVDVIVNAWNRNIIPWWLLLPQGVSGAIKKRGGTGPFKETSQHGPIPLGGAVPTSAGRLPLPCERHVSDCRELIGPLPVSHCIQVRREVSDTTKSRRTAIFFRADCSR